MISHLKWMGHSETIYEIQRNLRDEVETCEVTLAAGEYTVRAHRFVLSSCSDLLRNLLADVPPGQEATIVVPDIKGALLDNVLAFIYMGEAQISSTNLSDFLEAINILGIKSAISFECSTLARTNPSTTTVPIKAIAGLEIVQEDIIEAENVGKIQTQEYLEMYSGDSQPKIHYAIEQMSGTNHGSEFILTENVGDLYTLTTTTTTTQSPSKLTGANVNTTNNASHNKVVDSMEVEEIENEIDAGDGGGGVGVGGAGDIEVGDEEEEDGSVMEELSNSVGDNLIELATNATTTATQRTDAATTTSAAGTMETTPAATIEIVENAQIYRESGHNASTLKLANTSRENRQRHQQRSKQTKYAQVKFDSNEANETKEFTIYQQQQQQQTVAVEIAMADKTASDITDPLELAVQCVINEGMSLQRAAQKHDISKTVLWRRVRKDPNYQKTTRENPVLVAACERLKNGESMKTISKELEIPMSTLHRHKVRLSLQGRLPKWVTFKKRDANSKDELREKLNKAVHACVHDGMSQNHAANLFEIPKSTLWRHLQKRMAEAEAMVAEEIKQEVI